MRTKEADCDQHVAAFTYLEVLVALLVLSVVMTAACSGTIASLRAEQTYVWLQESRFILRQLDTSHRLGLDDIATIAGDYEDWRVTRDTIKTRSGSTPPTEWLLWTIYPVSRPTLSTDLALQGL